jgi:hypothetical protein
MSGTAEGQRPDTTFSFSNGNEIILCGFKEVDNNQSYFSEFILQVCGQDSIVDFWGAVQTCRLSKVQDTLKIVETKNLPTGINRSFVRTDWYIEKISFRQGKLIRSSSVNWNIRKYSRQEIKQTRKEFETAPKTYDEHRMHLAYRLFISTICGDKTSLKYFKDFAKKFGALDGGDLEEYKDLEAMLSLWGIK